MGKIILRRGVHYNILNYNELLMPLVYFVNVIITYTISSQVNKLLKQNKCSLIQFT